MQRTLLGSALFVVVVLGALAMWASRHLAELESLNGPVRSGPPASGQVERPSEALERTGDIERVHAEVEPVGREIVSKTSPGLTVLVVERETSRPIHGAEVCASTQVELGDAALAVPELLRVTRPDPFTLAAAMRRLARTDEQGLARIALEGREGLVAARASERWGTVEVHEQNGAWGVTPAPRGDAPVRIELPLDRSLLLRAVDASGRPLAGVPLALTAHWEGRHRLDKWRGLTGADGTVCVAHLQRFFDELPEARQLGARAVIVGRERPVQAVGLDSERLTIELPPCGSLRVPTLDADGAPLSTERVHARPAQTDVQGIGLSFSNSAEQAPELGHGYARFPFVETGLTVQLRGEHAEHDVQRAEGPGPIAPGSEAVIELRFGTPSLLLVGRCVTEEGAPIPDTSVRIQGAWRPDISAHFTVRTDAEGRFRHALQSEAPQRSSLQLSLRILDGGAHSGREGRVERELDLVRGANDIGDIVLAAPVPLVAGVVLDDTGRPIAGARVWASWIDRPRTHPVSNPIRTGETDAEGRFELSGNVDEPDFLLEAQADGHIGPGRRIVATGARGVELVLVREASLVARYRFHPSVPGTKLVARLAGERWHRDGLVDAEHAVRFVRCPRGRAILELLHPQGAIVVDARPDVDLVPGTTTDLGVIDLSDELRGLLVHVRDREGQVVEEAVLRVGPSGGALLEHGWLQKGEGWAVLTARTFDLEIEARQFYAERLEGVAGEVSVALTRAPGLHLTLPLGLVEPDSVEVLEALLVPVPRGQRSGMSQEEQARLALDPGTVVDRTPSTGRYALHPKRPGPHALLWRWSRDAGADPVYVGPEPALVIDFPAAGMPDRAFDHGPDPRALERARAHAPR